MTQCCSGILTLNSQPAKNPHTEFFKITVRDSGIKLVSSDDPNVITQEQALVVRDIEKTLDLNPEENTNNFLKGFKVLIKKEKYLRKALLPTLFKRRDDFDPDVKIQQESLFRIFLQVSHLQTEIIDILLNELTSTISEEEADVPRLRLLLSQLRYLPRIKDPKTLSTKLLDVIDIASYPSQLDILDSIPKILPDSEYNQIAEELMKMLDRNDDLTGAIIDCLNALSLNSEIRAQIQDHILSKILTGTSLKVFPLFLDFLMSDYTVRELPTTLLKIRNALNTLMGQNDKEKESSKIVTFNQLQKSAASKIVSESWVSVISNIKNPADHKPVDLLILFMLHSSMKLKKRTIETTFRKRVKDGQFKCSLLEQMFEKYLPQQLQRDYFNSIVEIGSSLLRGSDDSLVTDFASTLFKLLFTNSNTERTYKQEILENMILLVGANDQKNAILNILTDLVEDISQNPSHAIILMRLLEKFQTFELNDVRLVFEILCRLTCYDEALLGLKEELHMVVRKHLTSANRSLQYRGIISAVVMAKHIATTDDQTDTAMSEDSIISITQLKGAAKEAATILELTGASAAGSPELTGLYYDQLGTMLVKSENLDKTFLVWLNESITSDFQSLYVTENVCEDINDLQFSIQYNLNSTDEMDTELAVNIAELTLKSAKNSILVLSSHFRLLRMLHYKQQNGDLSSIDALLGCGVVLPKFEQRDSLGIDQLKQMSDCIFHCINWFRETISAFVTQKDKKLRAKVVKRVDDLQELEKLLEECLESIPNHKLPQSYFNSSTQSVSKTSPGKEKPTRAPRKKLKTKEFVDSTVPSTSKLKKTKAKEEQQLVFREIDTDILILLKYPLSFDVSDQITLNVNQLNFILKDFVTKLTLLTKKRDLGLSHLNIITPLELMTDCEKILLNVNRHFEVILPKLDENEDLGTTFGLILECLSLVFSWSGFQHSKSLDLLRNILKALRTQEGTPLNSVNHLTVELVNRLSGYSDHCSTLVQAVNLVKTLEALYILSPNHSTRSKIAKTAGKLLNNKWESVNTLNIDVLVKSYLSSANTKALCGMVGTLQNEVSTLTNKSDRLEMLASVNKSNFYILYRNLWSSLHERVKTEIQSLTNAKHLALWRTTALTMQGLMTIAKAQETKQNLSCFLKKSIAILKIFLSHGIPILEIELKSEPDRVVEILKTIQSNTRFLHHLCCYSKVTKDGGLMPYVPQFRLTLESLVYRVKAALVANNCSTAFWMGNLKNRDLQGEDILSQSTENTVEEEEEEEVVPSDDDGGSNTSEVFD